MRHISLDENGELNKWLTSRYGRKDIRKIAEDIAHDLLLATKQVKPPIDLSPICSFRHIKEILSPALKSDARLLVRDNGFLIQISKQFQTRRRFTLAHEIAHTYFYDLETSKPKRMFFGSKPNEEEQFCDILASEIVMPSFMIQEEFSKVLRKNPNISPLVILEQLAQTFRVSDEAMARRITEDLNLLHGVILNVRWLPSTKQDINSQPNNYDWRLHWWAASLDIVEQLYLPLASKRPKLDMSSLESIYNNRQPAKLNIQISEVKIGNLKKIVTQFNPGLNSLDIWVYPIIPDGIQLGSVINGKGVTDIEEQTRQQSEINLFFPTNNM